MAYANHRIFMLIQVGQLDEAKAEVLDALKRHGMHKSKTANSLGCGHGTFLRWIKALAIEKEIGLMTKRAKKEGWYDRGKAGRPKGSTVANGAKRRSDRKEKSGKKVAPHKFPSRSSLRRRTATVSG